MTTVTLQQLEAARDDFAALIERFKQQPVELPAILSFSAEIKLAPGEHYAGIVLGADGKPAHHLVLLPGDADDCTWQEAKDWAASAGGELPTRQEQALLYANCKAQFQPAWYWSAEEHETNSSCAWCQIFNDGYQTSSLKDDTCRARAVRRFAA